MTIVAVSILNHNSAQSTVACIQSLLVADQVGYVLEVIVADNASEEGDRRYLQQSIVDQRNVKLRINSENLGFAAGHNRNLEDIFLRFNPDYVWVLNSDCLVQANALSRLIESAERHPEVGIWGATLLESDGETIQCAGGCFYNSWLSSYRQYGQSRALNDIDQLENPVFDYIAGASMFLPLATLQKGLQPARALPVEKHTVGQQWLNESFFLYFEELDLVKRLNSGFGMGWCKEALIRHSGGVSTGAFENQRTELAEYHSTLSALKFTRLYYPHRLWIVVPARYFSKLLLLLVRGDLRLIGSLSRAYREFWRRPD